MPQYFSGKVLRPSTTFSISFTCPWNTHQDPGISSRAYTKDDSYSLDNYFNYSVDSAGVITLTAKETLNVTLTGAMVTDGIDDAAGGSGQGVTNFSAIFPSQNYLYQNMVFYSGYPDIGGNNPPEVYRPNTLTLQEVSTILASGETIKLAANLTVDGGGWNIIKFDGGWTLTIGTAYAPPTSMRLDLNLSLTQRAYYENGTGVPVAVLPPEPQVWQSIFSSYNAATPVDRCGSLYVSWVSHSGNNNGFVRGYIGTISSDKLTLTLMIPGLPSDTYDFTFLSVMGGVTDPAYFTDHWSLGWTIGGTFLNKTYNPGETLAFTLPYQESTYRVYIVG